MGVCPRVSKKGQCLRITLTTFQRLSTKTNFSISIDKGVFNMIISTEVSQEDNKLMAQFNVKTETRTMFYSEGYKYDNLKDALSYGKLSVERKGASGDE
jgi:hypothetical protein